MSSDEKEPHDTGISSGEPRVDVCVPRKKRMMKCQPRQMQSSIDVLAEVLAERFAEEGVYESEELYEPEEEEAGNDGFEGEEPIVSSRDQRAANRVQEREMRIASKMAKKRIEPYKFTKCKLRNRHFLREGQGLAMLRSLGLEQFLLHTEVPRFHKAYCTDFITTYNHHKGSGMVNGKVVKITAQAIRKLTGLPLGTRGERAEVHDVRAEDLPIMDRLIPGLKRTSYGYDLRYLRYKDQTETFVAVASALSEKLVCRTFKLTYIKGAIILAMETSLRLKVLMQWAEFMAESIRNAIKLTKLRTRNVRFAFGEWLSGLIENALAEDLEGEKGTGLVENAPRELQIDIKPQEEIMETGDTAMEVAEANPPEGFLALPQGSPAAHQEALPLVVHNSHPLHIHKVKKRGRTTANAGGANEEIKRLQQQLADAEKRERWFVALNLNMSREMESLRQALASVKDNQNAALTMGDDEKETEGEVKHETELQLVLKENPESASATLRAAEEQQHVERLLIEHLEKKSARHEQEMSRLKDEVQDQQNLLELIKKGRSVPYETYMETFDAYASLKREHKRLRREWEKEKEKMK